MFSSERITERGIVVRSENGKAEVAILAQENCKTCSAKPYCVPAGNEKVNYVNVKDPFSTSPGDEVTLAITGNTLMKMSMVFYGIPLIILIAVILVMGPLFSGIKQGEAYSVMTGLAVMMLYYAGIYFLGKSLGKSNSPKNLPEIISVKKFNQPHYNIL
ncbi:MAG: SoxR reducing system RseC family protein [Ignavibacteriaceae bacterium]|nr:SoxR reducing system RseC family protein [Ignavibacteriaceae bacterium]NUM69905.1 SoxR reducing system RseC family protein [Ignavibacteriaceae bacterium]